MRNKRTNRLLKRGNSKCALSLGGLRRIARIARPGALYDASVSVPICDTIGESIINPIDFEEAPDVTVSKAIGANSYSHMPGSEDFNRNFQKRRIA